MKTADDLQHYCRKELRRELTDFERRRKTMLYSFALLPIGVALVCLLLYLAQPQTQLSLVAGILGFIGSVVYVAVRVSGYSRDFKKQVMTRLVKFLAPSLEYLPREGIADHVVRQAEIVERSVSAVRSEDRIRGDLEGRHVDACELTINPGNDNATFHGLFVVIETHRDFGPRFRVRRDFMAALDKAGAGKLAAFVKSLVPQPRGHKVAFDDDPEFSEHYAVYAEDADTAAAVFDAHLRHRLMQFPTDYHSTLSITCDGNTVYVGLATERQLFEPHITRPAYDPQNVIGFFNDFHLIWELVEIFDPSGDRES